MGKKQPRTSSRNSYNHFVLRYFGSRLLAYGFLLATFLAAACGLLAAQAPAGTQTLLVMPFDNMSKAPGLEWISEAFPEVLSQRMASDKLRPTNREDRSYAFDHSGVPAVVRPSRATIYRVAEQMDADYVVFGSFDFDGNTFTATARLLDMAKLHLYPMVQSSGRLNDLINLQTTLAWELLHQIPSLRLVSRDEFLKSFPPIRLDAFENYIRGLMATNRQQKVRYFHNAVRLNPNYTLAMLQLGKAYYDDHEYETAASWLSRVPKNDAAFGEATFLLGMSEFYRGALDRAYNAFNTLAARIPLPEVYNNLGVVEDRRGRNAQAILCFSKVVESDPNDPDYRFNLAVALFKNGNPQGAAAQLKEALQRRSSDGEARSLLDYLSRGGTVQVSSPAGTGTAANSVLPASRPPAPMERVKRNYDEASYRQLELEIHNLQELRLAGGDRRSHAQYHADRGESMLAQGLTEQAEDEFREAIGADYNNAAAHAGLARILEQKGETFNARSEAETSVRIQPSVDALLVLARLNLKQNQLQAASQAVNRALVLEPANQAAQSLQRDIAARQSTVQ